MKVSIIIPIYNVEQWLERCVKSVENQDIPQNDYEVILVNDGSTDGSAAICSALVEKYPNVRLVSKENGGISSARNAGLDVAVGEYVMFVDSDDFIYPNVLKYLLDCCKTNNLDICHYNMTVEDEQGKTSRSRPAFSCNSVLSGRDVYSYYVLGSVCSNVIRASLIKKLGFRFTLNIMHEDVEFNTRLFCYIERITFVDKDIYHYTFNPRSMWRSKRLENQEKDIKDALFVSSLQLKFARNSDIDPWFKERIQNMVNTDVVCGILSFFRMEGPSYSMFKKYIGWAQYYGLYPIHTHYLRPKFKIIGTLLNAKSLVKIVVRLLDKLK